MNAIHSVNLWQELLAESVSPPVPTLCTHQDRGRHYTRGELELVREPIRRWLADHATAPNASFVYKAWLDARGDRELVREPISAWLGEHATARDAQFVYKAWLDAGGKRELVREPMSRWLAEHATAREASFVYTGWLDAGGERDLVRDPISRWLAERATAREARFVYKAWLDAGGERELAREPMSRWLAEHATAREASFVYGGWLDAGGERDLVRDPISRWLAEHATAHEAQFVYKAWLDAGGARDLVRDPISRWLHDHGTVLDAGYIYGAWLKAGGAFGQVRADLERWVHANRGQEKAGLLLKHVAREPALSLETVRDILEWCANFPSNEDSLWRVTALGSRHLRRRGVGDRLVEAARAIIDALPPRPDSVTRGQVTELIYFVVASPDLKLPTYRETADDVVLAWLRHPASYGRDPRPHRWVQRRPYVQRIADIVAAGRANADAEHGARRFLEWINEWEPEQRLAVQGIAHKLRERLAASAKRLPQMSRSCSR